MKKDGLVISKARRDELDEIAGLMRDAYVQYRDELPAGAWGFYESDIMDVRARLSTADLIVARLEGKPVGAVTLYLRSDTWPEGWAGVRLLAVPSEYRGRGIGRALMNECIRRCRRRGIRTIGLHTTPMMEAAVRLYEKMGFKRIPEHDHHPAPGVTVMAYRLDLQPQQP